MVKFYVTTAIDYVNASPHIGHAYQKIAADILARYHKLKGDQVFFLTGTDEHGSKILKSANQQNIPVKKFVDKLAIQFKNAWKFLDIDMDRFIRTTDADHEKAVQEFIKLVNKKGDIYKSEYEGLYCEGCERYLTERDLVDGKCPFHNIEPQILKEEAYFFKLSKYQNKLLELYKKHPEYISPKQRRQEVINRVKEGLKDLCITRTSFKWGIPFPLEKGHIIYVWYEALLNYITGIGWPNKKYEKFWPADVELLGKDNAWFHCVIWPAMLMSAGIKPAKKIFVHGFLTFNGQKISKSLGNVISPEYLVKRYGSDAVRYFSMRDVAFGEDGDFSEKSLVERYNTELANELGNLLSRSITMIEKYANKTVPRGTFDKKLETLSKKTIKSVEKNMNDLEFHVALKNTWKFISETNKHIQDKKPWEKPKNLNDILYTIAESLRIISYLTYPFIPKASKEIAKQLGIKDVTRKIKPGTKVKRGGILFKKIEYAAEDPFSKLDLKVAEIKKVEDIAGADKLLKLKLNDRQIVAGIKQYYSKKELLGKKIVIVANLKPAKLCGELSQGMLLAAEKKGKVELIFTRARVGEDIIAENLDKKPEKEIKFEDFMKIKIRTNNDGYVVYGKKRLKAGKECLKVTLKNAKVR
ncbi:MAG: methionine--tRNA ligase [Candidatus Woesearchaeota archaeon]|nr:MAG: methionine--tRNA ligase [Candidatus Woesearchaeota archaeon]